MQKMDIDELEQGQGRQQQEEGEDVRTTNISMKGITNVGNNAGVQDMETDSAYIDLFDIGYRPKTTTAPSFWHIKTSVSLGIKSLALSSNSEHGKINGNEGKESLIVDSMEKLDLDPNARNRLSVNLFDNTEKIVITTKQGQEVSQGSSNMAETPLFALAYASAPVLFRNERKNEQEEGGGEGEGEEQNKQEGITMTQSMLRLLPLWDAVPLRPESLLDLPFHLIPNIQQGQRLKMNQMLHEYLIFPAAVPTSNLLALLDHQHSYTPISLNQILVEALFTLIAVGEKMLFHEALTLGKQKEDTHGADILVGRLDTAIRTREKLTDKLCTWLNSEMEKMRASIVAEISVTVMQEKERKEEIRQEKEGAHNEENEPLEKMQIDSNTDDSNNERDQSSQEKQQRQQQYKNQVVPLPATRIPAKTRVRIVKLVGSLLDLFFQRYVHLLEHHAFTILPAAPRKSYLPKDKWPESDSPSPMRGYYKQENPYCQCNVPPPLRSLFYRMIPLADKASFLKSEYQKTKSVNPHAADGDDDDDDDDDATGNRDDSEISLDKHADQNALPAFMDSCNRESAGMDDMELLAAQLGAVKQAWALTEGPECQNPYFAFSGMSSDVREAITMLQKDKHRAILHFRNNLTREALYELRMSAFICLLQTRFVGPNYTSKTTTTTTTTTNHK